LIESTPLWRNCSDVLPTRRLLSGRIVNLNFSQGFCSFFGFSLFFFLFLFFLFFFFLFFLFSSFLEGGEIVSLDLLIFLFFSPQGKEKGLCFLFEIPPFPFDWLYSVSLGARFPLPL